MVTRVMLRSRTHDQQILRLVSNLLESDLSHKLLMVTSDNVGTNADHLWLFSPWLRSLLASVRREENLIILPDFTSEELEQAMQVLQFSQQGRRVFNGVTKDILEILGVGIDKYESVESQPEMEETYSNEVDTKNNYNESEKKYEMETDDDDDTDQTIQNQLMMANQNLSDSESDEEEEQTVDKDEMYLGVQNILLQDQDLDDTDSDSDEENKEEQIMLQNNQPRFKEEDIDRNISAKINQEIKNLLEKSTDGYICKVCGKPGRMRQTITRHIETHLEGYSHPCNQCKDVMPTRNARRQHIRNKHTN